MGRLATSTASFSSPANALEKLAGYWIELEHGPDCVAEDKDMYPEAHLTLSAYWDIKRLCDGIKA